MKILFVDTSMSGHHRNYAAALLRAAGDTCGLISAEETCDLTPHYWCVKKAGKSLRQYRAYLKRIAAIAEEFKPNIIHFLYGDAHYRYFGLFFGLFRRYKTVVTFHWMREGLLQRVSTRRICRKVSRAVVHSAYIERYFFSLGIKNAVHIEYPVFQIPSFENPKAYWDIDNQVPVIACIGNTRYDKGLDILLRALQSVSASRFRLLIAGKPDAFDEAYIDAHTQGMAVTKCLHFLSDEELGYALGAADIICLPYRKIFGGASGPLGEGAVLGKCIVGPNHGNLGDTIEKNHLGYTFDTENAESLSEALSRALDETFVPDAVCLAYRETLRVEYFTQGYMALYRSLE